MPNYDQAFKQLVAGVGTLTERGRMMANGCGVSISPSALPAIDAYMARLTKNDVLVGIPASNAARKDGDPMNNPTRLYIHENGSPAANIPARPTMAPGIRDVQDKLNDEFAAAARYVGNGSQANIDRRLRRAGTIARDSIKNRINSNTPPPLAERTLQDRRARGKQSTATLVDEGEMRNAVTYVIRAKS